MLLREKVKEEDKNSRRNDLANSNKDALTLASRFIGTLSVFNRDISSNT